MEEYVFVDGKKYRRGYTTGSCAAAASKAAFQMLITGTEVESIQIPTPKGIDLSIKVENMEIGENCCICSVKKDGGDDMDATHMMDIFSRVEIVGRDYEPEHTCERLSKYIEVSSGTGIGVVTKDGLSVEKGRPAINPVPLEMIYGEVESVIEDLEVDLQSLLSLGKEQEKKILITIWAPDGEKVALKTFNPNLGIEGGISIIGTSGIVEPMSDEGWKKSLSAELSIKKAEGLDRIYLVPGNIGFEKLVENYGTGPGMIVKMSNFAGYMIMECVRYGFSEIVIAGHIGKLIKLSAGIMNTHSRVADARSEIMIANLALAGASCEVLKKIESCVTTDAMIPVIKESGFEDVFDILAEKAAIRAKRHSRDENLKVSVIMMSMEGEILGKYGI